MGFLRNLFKKKKKEAPPNHDLMPYAPSMWEVATAGLDRVPRRPPRPATMSENYPPSKISASRTIGHMNAEGTSYASAYGIHPSDAVTRSALNLTNEVSRTAMLSMNEMMAAQGAFMESNVIATRPQENPPPIEDVSIPEDRPRRSLLRDA